MTNKEINDFLDELDKEIPNEFKTRLPHLHDRTVQACIDEWNNYFDELESEKRINKK